MVEAAERFGRNSVLAPKTMAEASRSRPGARGSYVAQVAWGNCRWSSVRSLSRVGERVSSTRIAKEAPAVEADSVRMRLISV